MTTVVPGCDVFCFTFKSPVFNFLLLLFPKVDLFLFCFSEVFCDAPPLAVATYYPGLGSYSALNSL